MKPRRVIVTLELETDVPLKVLRSRSEWDEAICFPPSNEIYVKQVQVNVVERGNKG